MLNRGGPISKLIGGTIGVAKEYQADSKERKAAAQAGQRQASLSQPSPASASRTNPQTNSLGNQDHEGYDAESSYDDDCTDEDERILDLDEAQQELASTEPTANNGLQEKFDMDRFIQRHPPPLGGTSSLSSFVLLPQRRPKSQHKGFVRAYAPELGHSGIDQDTWLEFLDGCEQSIRKNSFFHVMNVSVFVAGNAAALTMGISPVLHMASMAIHASVEASRRGYLNHQQNSYLNAMNEKFFKPRGLYCMVVKYEPSSNDAVQSVDLESKINKSINASQEQSKWRSPFSSSSMKIEGDMEMPTPAPLVFPELPNTNEETPSNSIKRFGRVVQSYKDRRAAAKFEAEDPDSKMPAAPRKAFASVYGDPNSVVNSGGFISLMSNGERTSIGPSGGLPDRLRESREARKTRRKQKKKNRPLHQMMKADALYLMVTNLPSNEVLDIVAAQRSE
ncbi:hypothetical protein ACHAQA_009994 [Verticillium albo-atrum]